MGMCVVVLRVVLLLNCVEFAMKYSLSAGPNSPGKPQPKQTVKTKPVYMSMIDAEVKLASTTKTVVATSRRAGRSAEDAAPIKPAALSVPSRVTSQSGSPLRGKGSGSQNNSPNKSPVGSPKVGAKKLAGSTGAVFVFIVLITAHCLVISRMMIVHCLVTVQ